MKNRSQETVSPLIQDYSSENPKAIGVFCSPSDVGVQRNLGRNGARFAPKAIINTLKKFNRHGQNGPLHLLTVSDQSCEKDDFHKAQLKSAENIKTHILKNHNKRTIHLGGGHDHVFPLLKAIDDSGKYENLLVFNIDAHCDTRVDDIHHSGTPFRDFDHIAKIPYHLIQYGIHDFANSKSTLSPLSKQKTKYIFQSELKILSKQFRSFPKEVLQELPFNISKKTALVLSLDCDALDGTVMKAVSAVNPQGLPPHHMGHIIEHLKTEFKDCDQYFGIYEYNPVYDDLSRLGALTVAQMLYQFISR